MTKQSTRLYTLDALRGLAIVLILLFHATELFELKLSRPFLFNSFKFADAGVEFFFVLSGFALVWTYFSKIGSKSSWKRFMARRALRIDPFYWLVNIAVLPIYFLWPAIGRGHETNLKVMLKSLLLIPQQQSPVLSVAWFLSYILLFYALFGLLLSLRYRLALPILGLWIGLSITLNMGAHAAGLEQNYLPFWMQFLFSLYGIEFAAGGLMAYYLRRYSIQPLWQTTFCLVGLIAFSGFALLDNTLLDGSNGFAMQGYEFITYGLASVFLVGGLASSEYSASEYSASEYGASEYNARQSGLSFVLLAGLRCLPKWLGAASYAIFLTHYLILPLGVKALALFGFNNSRLLNLGMITCCLIAVWIGQLSHRYVERPLTQFADSSVRQLWKYFHPKYS